VFGLGHQQQLGPAWLRRSTSYQFQVDKTDQVAFIQSSILGRSNSEQGPAVQQQQAL
jgi:hypothetical protein